MLYTILTNHDYIEHLGSWINLDDTNPFGKRVQNYAYRLWHAPGLVLATGELLDPEDDSQQREIRLKSFLQSRKKIVSEIEREIYRVEILEQDKKALAKLSKQEHLSASLSAIHKSFDQMLEKSQTVGDHDDLIITIAEYGKNIRGLGFEKLISKTILLVQKVKNEMLIHKYKKSILARTARLESLMKEGDYQTANNECRWILSKLVQMDDKELNSLYSTVTKNQRVCISHLSGVYVETCSASDFVETCKRACFDYLHDFDIETFMPNQFRQLHVFISKLEAMLSREDLDEASLKIEVLKTILEFNTTLSDPLIQDEIDKNFDSFCNHSVKECFEKLTQAKQ